ncbi:MAG: nuclear transport factor 2 family protein [Candidatus Obscuribacterales bacterium]|nr:nuclear transport factor 2 family protein [Candidatus Obscuribacterales bacterium]
MPLNFQDKMEIQDLIVRYANAMDSGKFDEWLETWADDGVWEGGLGVYAGKTALAKLPGDLGARIQGKRHLMSNFAIFESGDQAMSQCYMVVVEREVSTAIVATGVYFDSLKKIDGGWKFARRKVQLDPSFAVTTSTLRQADC